MGPISGSYRILRGGSWKDSDVEFLRVAYRSQLDQPLSINTIGFRCAKDAR
jgi:formylglycine-generating enzyme required for sulfatase activity